MDGGGIGSGDVQSPGLGVPKPLDAYRDRERNRSTEFQCATRLVLASSKVSFSSTPLATLPITCARTIPMPFASHNVLLVRGASPAVVVEVIVAATCTTFV